MTRESALSRTSLQFRRGLPHVLDTRDGPAVTVLIRVLSVSLHVTLVCSLRLSVSVWLARVREWVIRVGFFVVSDLPTKI